MRVGTSHFTSMAAAVAYYRPYGYTSPLAAVMRKLAEGEIHIGEPALKPGDRLTVIDDGARYAIESEG